MFGMELHWTFILMCQLLLGKFTAFAAPEAKPSLEPVPQPLARKSSTPTAPFITEQPSNVLIDRGSNTDVRLNCRAGGFPKPTISWMKDGEPFNPNRPGLVAMPNGELIFFRIITKGDDASSGIYQCIATNSVGSVHSKNASIQIASINKDFRENPRDTVAALGGSATIQCEGPRGIPEPDISWRKDGRELATNNRIQVNQGDLVINRLAKTDSGSYECVADNRAGSRTSTAALLMVQVPPTFTLLPSDQDVIAGKSVELECRADGDPAPRIKWSRVGGTIPDRLVPLSNGNMRISGVEAGDEGVYMCTAENRVGKESATAVITVRAEPEIIDVASDTDVPVGDTITLTCRVEGNPKPAVFWRYQHGNEMFTENSYQGGHLFVAASGDLIIYSVRFEDQGSYTCQAYNSVGSVTAEVQLTVQPRRTSIPPPVIKRGPTNASIGIDGTVVFQCSSTSSPEADINWYKDGEAVDTGRSRFFQLSSGNLQISSVQKPDAGRYTCKASNDHGITAWDAWLKVVARGATTSQVATRQQLPRAPSKPVMVNSTSNSITLSWQDDLHTGASPVLYHFIEYYRIGSTSSSWERKTRVLDTIYKVRHLTASSDYVFIVRSVNSHGISDPSLISTSMRTTDEAVANPSTAPDDTELNAVVVRLVQAEPIQSGTGSVRLKWETAGGCDTIDGFMVVTQPVTAPTNNLFTKQVSCLFRTYDLTNLVSGTKYEVRIRPYKGTFTGRASPIVFVSLQEGLMQAEPPTLSAAVDSDAERSVTFRWQPPRDLPAAYVTGYALHCRTQGTYKRTQRVNSSTTEVTLTDLPGDATYIASVTYSTQLGDGVTSAEKEVVLGAVATEGPSGDDGFVGMLQRQPAIIAGLAVALLVVLAALVGGVCYYKKSRRNGKARGLHVRSFSFTPHSGPHRTNHLDRFEASSPYSPGFQITKTVPNQMAPGGGSGGDVGGEMGGHVGQGDTSRVYLQRTPMNTGAPSNVQKNTVVTYNAKNGEIGSCIDDKPTGIALPTQAGFSYVADQLTSKTDIPPQFARPSLASTQVSTIQQLQQHQQQLSRQRSGSSNLFGGSNPDGDMRYTDHYSGSTCNIRNAGELPPPPPSPPLSQRTAISDRSRASSTRQSTGDRSSRSGQRSRRGPRGNRMPNAPPGPYLPADADTCIDSPQHTPSPSRPDELRVSTSPAPPTPPVRVASNYPYGHPVMQFDHNRDPTLNLGYLAGPSEGDTDNETDQLGKLRVRTFNVDQDPRNSVAVSNVSMMNGYGSETEERDSYDQDSTASLSSDEESLQMESASQVGQNLLRDDDISSLPNPQPRLFKQTGDNSPQRQYAHPYHHHPNDQEPLIMDNSGQNLISGKPRPSRKPGAKNRRPKTSSANLNRMNSASSSSSSYHQNTGDSGMSAGVGCSTEHSSLNSSASGGSSASKSVGSKVNRSRTAGNLSSFDSTPTGQANPETIPILDIKSALAGNHAHDSNYSTPASPTASGISEQSGYVSTASSCWQFQPPSPTKQQQQTPRRPPRMGTGGRLPVNSPQRPNNLPTDPNSLPYNINSKINSQSSPLRHPNSPDQTPIYPEYDVTPTNYNHGANQFQAARAAFGGNVGPKTAHGRPQELSDVPEVLTSDFCEDYSDQSQ